MYWYNIGSIKERRRIRIVGSKASVATWIMSQRRLFTDRWLHDFIANIPLNTLKISILSITVHNEN